MRKVTRHGKIIIGVSVAGAVLASGTAWAAFQANGSGAGSGNSGSLIPLDATGTPTNGALLYPGVQRDLTVAVTNRNAFPVKVTQVRRSTDPVIVDGPHATAGCVQSGVTLASAAFVVTWDVPANSTTSFPLPNGIKMTNDSDSACQGASFTVPIIVSGTA